MSASSSESRTRYCNRPPTHCKCNLRLERRVSWTQRNPARRFLVCPKPSFDSSKCDTFIWIDVELNNDWYKQRMYEMYMIMNNEDREVYEDEVSQHELEIEFGNYMAGMEAALGKAQANLSKWRRISNFLMVIFMVLFAMILVVL